MGEEPPISGDSGICNVFFSHCNLQCVYCQNHQISNNEIEIESVSLEKVIEQITKILNTGVRSLGFVSPSHQIPQMTRIIDAIRAKGYNPIIVYNTNSYDTVETIALLESYVDVYLADFKYADNSLGEELSGIKKYADFATLAIREMITQKGTSLLLDDQGIALKGVIIRHLVLPGHPENSIEVLNRLADMSDSKITLSLMSQYYPAYKAMEFPALNRSLQQKEYQRIVDYLDCLGFKNGWIQELESQDTYQPDFNNEHPFEKTN